MKSFSSGEVANYCNVNARTVMRWINSGKLSAFKLPGRGNNRVSQDDLLQFFAANNIPTPDEFKVIVDRNCVIISKDKYFIRHAKRLVRNADFVTYFHTNELEAGIEIATKQPDLMVLDASVFSDSSLSAAQKLAERIKTAVSRKLSIMLFVEDDDDELTLPLDDSLIILKKPLDLSVFAHTLETLN